MGGDISRRPESGEDARGADPIIDDPIIVTDWRNWTLSPAEEILRPERDWEGAKEKLKASRFGGGRGKNELRDPHVFRDTDGALYLYCLLRRRCHWRGPPDTDKHR